MSDKWVSYSWIKIAATLCLSWVGSNCLNKSDWIIKCEWIALHLFVFYAVLLKALEESDGMNVPDVTAPVITECQTSPTRRGFLCSAAWERRPAGLNVHCDPNEKIETDSRPVGVFVEGGDKAGRGWLWCQTVIKFCFCGKMCPTQFPTGVNTSFCVCACCTCIIAQHDF